MPLGWEIQGLDKYLDVEGLVLDASCGTGRHIVLLARRGLTL